MSAIITERIKKVMIQNLYDDISDSANNYYIALGKSDDWDSADNAPTPLPTEREIRNFRLAAQSAKQVTDWSFVVPRYNWTTGTTYYGYNDNNSGHPLNSYYVLTDDNAVFICLRQGRNTAGATVPSTVKPTGITTTPFITADGYVWKFLYTVGTTYANRFLAANYMPVRYQTATDSNSLAVEVEQETIQNAARPKQIAGIELITGGSGYTSAPRALVVGNGTGCDSAVATVFGGTVTRVQLKESNGSIVQGTGYDWAEIKFQGGGGAGATARVILGPKNGFGADPRDDLRATAIMFNTKPDGAEGGAFVVNNDFRQLALIKNPTDSAGNLYAAAVGNMLKRLKFGTVSAAFTPDHTILGSTSGARGWVDKADSDEVWYHQTEATGFAQFIEGEVVAEIDGSGTGTLVAAGTDPDSLAYIKPSIDPFSGEVLYIENRSAVQRSAGQIEDIKIIVQL